MYLSVCLSTDIDRVNLLSAIHEGDVEWRAYTGEPAAHEGQCAHEARVATRIRSFFILKRALVSMSAFSYILAAFESMCVLGLSMSVRCLYARTF